MTSGSSTSRAKVSSAPMLLSGSCGTTGALVAPPGQRVQVRAGGLAERAHQGGTGVLAMSPTVRRPSRGSSSSVFSPTPHSAPTGSGCRKATTSCGGDDEQAVGLAPGRGELGDELACSRRPTEQVMPCSSATRSRISCADLGGPAEPADRAGDVEERLVEGQRLDQRGDRAEDLHHAGGDRGVAAVAAAATTVACGHSRRARVIGIAECTP